MESPILKYNCINKIGRNMICARIFKPYTLRLLFKCLVIFIAILMVMYICGITNHFYEENFQKFKHPYEGNIEGYVLQLRQHKKPTKSVINEYKYDYLTDCRHKCSNNISLRLVLIIKSAMTHFDQRIAIRRTWGYEKRFSDVQIRTVFLLGVGDNNKLQGQINDEYMKYKDTIQANFTDAYYNNTIKTMMGFKWAVTLCPYSKFYMFCDDDMYISTKNVLRYIRHPTKYPVYLTDIEATLNNVLLRRPRRQLIDFDLPDGIRFYSGYVHKAAPYRNIFSKWYVPLEEYRYDEYPLYATAGAYILSKEALLDMYYASFYTEHFRFDDVYLGILAHKIGILPYNSNGFHIKKPKYTPDTYKYLIASHGYDNIEELLKVWNQQRDLGNA